MGYLNQICYNDSSGIVFSICIAYSKSMFAHLHLISAYRVTYKEIFFNQWSNNVDKKTKRVMTVLLLLASLLVLVATKKGPCGATMRRSSEISGQLLRLPHSVIPAPTWSCT